MHLLCASQQASRPLSPAVTKCSGASPVGGGPGGAPFLRVGAAGGGSTWMSSTASSTAIDLVRVRVRVRVGVW